jgi:hypothetical protein
MAIGVIAYIGFSVGSLSFPGHTGGVCISKDGSQTFSAPVQTYTYGVYTDDSQAFISGEWVSPLSILVCGQSTCAYSSDGGTAFTAFAPLKTLGINKDTGAQPYHVFRTPDAQGRARLLAMASGNLDGGLATKSAIEYSINTANGAVVQTWRTAAPCGASELIANPRHVAASPQGSMSKFKRPTPMLQYTYVRCMLCVCVCSFIHMFGHQ